MCFDYKSLAGQTLSVDRTKLWIFIRRTFSHGKLTASDIIVDLDTSYFLYYARTIVLTGSVLKKSKTCKIHLPFLSLKPVKYFSKIGFV